MTQTKMMLVGESLSIEEYNRHDAQAFTDSAGSILDMLLRGVGIARSDLYCTNVMMRAPSEGSNYLLNYYGTKLDALPGFPGIESGKYVRAEFAPELVRLADEIQREQPNVIIAAGRLALWALAGTTGLKKARGAPLASTERFGRRKIIPTYAFTSVRSDWKLRPVVMADLAKAKRESEFPEIRRPRREFWLYPTIDNLYEFEYRFIMPGAPLSTDIETASGQITCIGFAPSPDIALVVPFVDAEQKDGNYWRTAREEREAWKWVKRICESHPHIGQNFLYDANYLWRVMGIRCFGMEDDTMLLHHALQPEMEKGLGFLGSVYTDEPAWKFMRARGSDITLKKEDD